MGKELPPLFLDRLKRIVPSEFLEAVMAGFSRPSFLSVRINTLKTDRTTILQRLKEGNISFKTVEK